MHVRTNQIALAAGLAVVLGSVALLAPRLASANSEADGTKFWGSVQRDDAHIVSYFLTVPPGETATITLGSGYRLELRAAPASGADNTSTVRLFDKGKTPLHERSDDGHSPANVSGSYAICRGSVVFISPAPTEAPTCSE